MYHTFKSLLCEKPSVLVLSEHWLWLYELASLDDISDDYEATGNADSRLTGTSNGGKGFGVVAILWHKRIGAIPVSDISSDRICVVHFCDPNDNSLTVSIIGVYLPCSNQGMDYYREHLQELKIIIKRIGAIPESDISSDRICVVRFCDPNDNRLTVSIIGVYLPCSNQGMDYYREHLQELETMILSFLDRSSPLVILMHILALWVVSVFQAIPIYKVFSLTSWTGTSYVQSLNVSGLQDPFTHMSVETQ